MNQRIRIFKRNPKRLAITLGLVGAVIFNLTPLEAGDWSGDSGKGSDIPFSKATDPVGIDFSIGYDSAYYFRGLWFSDNNVWVAAETSIPLQDSLSFDFNTYYTDNFSSGGLNYAELGAGAGLTHDAGFASFTLGYNWYYFFNQFFGNDVGQHYAHEVGLSASVPVGDFNLSLGYYYDLFIAAHYMEAGIDTEIPVSDRLSIVPSAVIGYGGNSYYTFGTATSAWNHVGLNLSLPYQLAPNAVSHPVCCCQLFAQWSRSTQSSPK